MANMVEVGVYPTRADAEIAQAALTVAGIPSILAADDAAGVLSGNEKEQA